MKSSFANGRTLVSRSERTDSGAAAEDGGAFSALAADPLGGKGSSVEQRNLGKSGLLVSVVGLGCNNFGGRIDFDATKKVVHKALDLGITFFDEADTYGNPRGSSEACLGQILGDRRKD